MDACEILHVQNFHCNRFEVSRTNTDLMEKLTALTVTNWDYSIDLICILSLHVFNWGIPL